MIAPDPSIPTPLAEASPADPSLLRAPVQERSRRTLQKILSAGMHLLAAEGPEALTVGAITRRSRVSVGSFYARFQGKDDLLRFLGEGALDESLSQWEAGASATEGPGKSLALLEGVQDPIPSRRRRFEERVTIALAAGMGDDPMRVGLRVRALIGLLHDAARRNALGQKGEVEYSFLPTEALLREEGIALLVGRGGSGTVQERESEAQRSEEVTLLPVGEPIEPAGERTPEPEPDPTAEPDPFDVWG